MEHSRTGSAGVSHNESASTEHIVNALITHVLANLGAHMIERPFEVLASPGYVKYSRAHCIFLDVTTMRSARR